MKNFWGKLKTKLKNKKIMVISLSTFVLIMIITLAIVNYSFGFKVTNEDDTNETFPVGYVLSKSNCVDVNNSEVQNVTDYDGDTIVVDPSKTVFCKLEFDLPGSSIITYDPSKSHAHNGQGEECHDVQCALDGLYELYKKDEGGK